MRFEGLIPPASAEAFFGQCHGRAPFIAHADHGQEPGEDLLAAMASVQVGETRPAV